MMFTKIFKHFDVPLEDQTSSTNSTLEDGDDESTRSSHRCGQSKRWLLNELDRDAPASDQLAEQVTL